MCIFFFILFQIYFPLAVIMSGGFLLDFGARLWRLCSHKGIDLDRVLPLELRQTMSPWSSLVHGGIVMPRPSFGSQLQCKEIVMLLQHTQTFYITVSFRGSRLVKKSHMWV